MNKAATLALFDELYRDIGGYQLSMEGRKKLGYPDSAYTYGEILPEEFLDILSSVSPKTGEVFYDLGSGTGKAVVLAGAGFELAKASGIEYIEDLHKSASEVLRHYHERFKLHFQHDPVTKVDVIHGDFLEAPWHDADIVFAHATCFHHSMIDRMTGHFEELEPGSRVILVSRELPSHAFTRIDSKEYRFNWGNAAVHTYIKNQ